MKYLNIRIGWYKFSVLYNNKDKPALKKIQGLFPFKKSKKRAKFLVEIVFTRPSCGLEIKIGKIASVFINGNSAKLYWKDVRSFPTLYAALYIFATYVHLKNNSLIIHGAGIKIKKGGYIFAGESGTGKTTIAQKIHPENLLNDEAVAIKPIRNNFYLKETPFGTLHYNTNELVRLNAIFLLKQAKNPSIQKIKFPYSTARVHEHIPFLYHFNHKLRKNSFLLVSKMCKKIPVFLTELTLKSNIKKIIKRVSE